MIIGLGDIQYLANCHVDPSSVPVSAAAWIAQNNASIDASNRVYQILGFPAVSPPTCLASQDAVMATSELPSTIQFAGFDIATLSPDKIRAASAALQAAKSKPGYVWGDVQAAVNKAVGAAPVPSYSGASTPDMDIARQQAANNAAATGGGSASPWPYIGIGLVGVVVLIEAMRG